MLNILIATQATEGLGGYPYRLASVCFCILIPGPIMITYVLSKFMQLYCTLNILVRAVKLVCNGNEEGPRTNFNLKTHTYPAGPKNLDQTRHRNPLLRINISASSTEEGTALKLPHWLQNRRYQQPCCLELVYQLFFWKKCKERMIQLVHTHYNYWCIRINIWRLVLL